MGLFSGIGNAVGSIGGFFKDNANWLSAGAGLLGGILRNRSQIGLANDQMDFQERMSSTAYQRAVKDMEAAGLNPMLAYQQGGASSPGGAMPTIGNVGAEGVASAAQGAQIVNATTTNDLIKAQTEKTQAEVAEVHAATTQKLASAGQLDAVRDNIRQEMTAFETRIKKMLAETTGIDWAGIKDKTQAELNRYAFYHLKPQEKELLAAQAAKYQNEARLLGLKVPEAVAEAAFWTKEPKATYFRHAPKNLTSATAGAVGAAASDIQDQFNR